MLEGSSLYIGLLTTAISGICIGWMLRGRFRTLPGGVARAMSETQTKAASAEGKTFAESGDLKLVLVVNNELKMGKGKAAAQCSHATLGCFQEAMARYPEVVDAWEQCGQPKVVVKSESEDEMKQLEKTARGLGLTTCFIRDAGRTQIRPGSKTVLGVGPAPADLVDQITGHLKLF